MSDYRELGYLSEEEFLEDYLGCDENWTLDDFFDSYDPDQRKLDMNDISQKKLERIVKKNVRLFNLKLVSKKENPFIVWEDYHLSTTVENELFSWGLQMTIGITEKVLIHMMMFMHPIIVEDDARLNFIEFANAANLWLGSALGRFWVNNYYCYELYLTELFMDNLTELEKQLFDKPF